MNDRWVRRVVLACAIALCLLLPVLVEARAGGGGHASSSGGRSSSGSSRSGSSYSRSGGYSSGGGGFIGGNIDDVIFVVVIGIGVVWWIVAAIAKSDGDESSGGGYERAPAESLAPLNLGPTKQAGSFIAYRLENIRQHDPLFHESHLIDHAQTVFALLQKARNDNELAPVLPFLDPNEADILKAEMDSAHAAGKRRVVEDAITSGAAIYRVEKHGGKDAIIVRIDASARDYYVDAATGARIPSSERPSPYTEYWTFERPDDAKTRGAGEALGSCPTCGAPLTLGSLSVCHSCGNPLPARQDDWLLAAIVQSLHPDAASASDGGSDEGGDGGKRDYLAAAAGDSRPIMRDLG